MKSKKQTKKDIPVVPRDSLQRNGLPLLMFALFLKIPFVRNFYVRIVADGRISIMEKKSNRVWIAIGVFSCFYAAVFVMRYPAVYFKILALIFLFFALFLIGFFGLWENQGKNI